MKSFLTVIVAFFIFSQPVYAQADPKIVLKEWIDKNAIDISLPDSSIAFSNLSAFKTMLGNTKIFALGEPLHNLSEPLELRNRLFKFMISEMGFNAIALETSFSQAKKINDFILGRSRGRAPLIANSNMSYGFGALKANSDLIEWVRRFNTTKPDHLKVRFYGIDLTGEFGKSAYPSIQSALDYIAVVDPDLFSELNPSLLDLKNDFIASAFVKLNEERRRQIRKNIIDLIKTLKDNRTRFIKRSSEEEFDWALQQAVNARYDEVFLESLPRNNDSTKNLPIVRSINLRDTAMAQNVEWIVKHSGKNRKVLLFAHNMHIFNGQNLPEENNPWFNLLKGSNAAGVSLRSMFGKDLFVMGIFYGTMRGNQFPDTMPVEKDEFSSLLDQSSSSQYLLNLENGSSKNDLYKFINKKLLIRNGYHGEARVYVNPVQGFDAAIFIRSVGAAPRAF
ncbi:MAG TPA: erythromycin esterase family protein [Chitinophagaceae bacterium]|nr:erythromycin esterase family protein [Chitinophagaceae bacterium]